MINKSIVAPSILAANAGIFAEEISSLENCKADWIHIDVMDGSFVPAITFGSNIVAVAKQSCSLFLDVHLMINTPENHFEIFKNAGADQITFHLETCSSIQKAKENLLAIKKLGIKAGLAIKPATNEQEAFELLPFCDLFLVMTVEPGKGGQSFIASSLSKIKNIATEISKNNSSCIVQVDGGINASTGLECFNNGATSLVAGSYILNSQYIERANKISSLRFSR